MAHPKKISGYSDLMLRIAEQLGRRERVEIRGPLKKPLEGLRFSFYGFRKAVEREHAEVLFPNLNRVSVRIEAQRAEGAGNDHSEWVLIFEDIDETPMAKLVESALRNVPPIPIPLEQPTTIIVPSTRGEPTMPSPKPSTHSEDIIEQLYGKKK